eukprot:sb/3468587/
MMMSGQAEKAAIVTLKAAQSQLVDENKRLKTELGQASNEIKNNCVREEKMKREISLLHAAGTELASLKTEHFKSQQQNQLLTQEIETFAGVLLVSQWDRKWAATKEEIEKLNNVRVDMQSEDVALVTFRSMESRIAHLEHQNSVLQAQLESSTSSSSITDYREPRESPREAALSRELGEIKKGAGLLEKNFKAEIADLRSKIVRLSAEIEQKNEALSDKGEVAGLTISSQNSGQSVGLPASSCFWTETVSDREYN